MFDIVLAEGTWFNDIHSHILTAVTTVVDPSLYHYLYTCITITYNTISSGAVQSIESTMVT